MNGTQLTVSLTAADLAVSGSLSLTVVNASPGGGTSNTASIAINAPPTLNLLSVTPLAFIVGSPATRIAVTGTGFSANSVVQWNGTALMTMYGNASNLSATVPANLLAATGTASITVQSPSAVRPLSNILTVTINNPPVPPRSAARWFQLFHP